MRRLIYLSMLSVFLCSASYADPLTGQFTLTRQSEETWIAKYCFDQAVNAFKFERPMSGNMRQDYWSVGDESFELTYAQEFNDSTATIQRKDKSQYTCFSISMLTYTDLPEKNYLAFSTFSDGGVTVYSGYLDGNAKRLDEWQETRLTAKYIPLKGNKVFARDVEAIEHQYVYFGPQDVVEESGSITIIDPAVPAKARQIILETMPKVNVEIGRLFGAVQSSPYMILMAGGELESYDGMSFKAGVQENQVAYTLKGKRLITHANTNPNWFAKHAAHEVIHLWQGEVWPQLGEDHPWMHEGSADALAYEFMHRRGFYTDEQYLSAWQKAESRCVKLLAKSSVHDGPNESNFDIVYQCGALVNRLVGTMLKPTDPGLGIWLFWQRMAELQHKNPSIAESEKLFFQALTSFDIKANKREALQGFLAAKPEDPSAALGRLKQKLAL